MPSIGARQTMRQRMDAMPHTWVVERGWQLRTLPAANRAGRWNTSQTGTGPRPPRPIAREARAAAPARRRGARRRIPDPLNLRAFLRGERDPLQEWRGWA